MLKRKFQIKINRGISILSIVSIILPSQLFAVFPALAGNPEQEEKILVCHTTHDPGTPYETIEVANQSALAAHLEHGDSEGECPERFSDISGCKFFDKDADGIRDDDEVTLPGWTIRLEDSGIVQYEKVTDLNGCYEFKNIEPGNYEISEVQMTGFRQTYPEGGKHMVSAVVNNNFINLDFGNTRDGRSYSCENPVILNFDSDSSRNPILTGQLIDSEYSTQGVDITAMNYNSSHPQKAIIFDSNNPSGNINGDHLKDIDLGTPNKMFGGVGDSQTGDGFEASNFKPLNNLLIIPDNDVDTSPVDGYVDDPNDEPAGGEFTFIFSRLFSFDSVQYIDLDHNSGEVRGFSDASSTAQVFSIPVEKDNGNSVQTVVGDATIQIKSLKFKANDSHAIDNVVLCPVVSCGDGFKEGDEQCDLRSLNGVECTPGYGETCQFCSGQCELREKIGPFCRDEVKNGDEECDGQDGVGLHEECSQECKIVQPPYCGDEAVNEDEECDDGNTQDGDGCSAQCMSEICQGNVVLNFDKDSSGENISAGQFIDEEYALWRIHVKANNNNASHPQFVITFDSSNPSGGINGDAIKDIDLGTPNKMFGGPGDSETGSGFEPSNNTSLYNLLIIPDNIVDTSPADGYVDDPNDEPAGGLLKFLFDRPYTFESAQYIDLDHSTGEVAGYSDATGTSQVFSIPVPRANGNSVQKVSGDTTTPIRFLAFQGQDSYAVDNVSLCPIVACGDGIKEGRELCDNGLQNGVECNPEYGLSCQFCTSECVLQEKEGPFCGDGIKNGEEACDGGENCADECEIIPEEPISGEICAVKYFDHDGNGRKDTGDENLSDWEITLSQKFECSEDDRWADSVVSFRQGLRGNGSAVDAERSDAAKALGVAQNDDTINFVSLGFGGELVLKLDAIIENLPGDDIAVTETSFGSPSCESYPEKARVYASQSGMVDSWVDLGQICLDKTLDLGSLSWARYLKFADVSDPDKFSGESDGYDVDGVRSIHCKKLLGVETSKTSMSGVCFDDLVFGEYHVEETMKGGWINTAPIGFQPTLSLTAPTSTAYFGNRPLQDVRLGAICGFKFEDINGDGKWQSSEGESGLGGWAIQAKQGERIYETQTSKDEESLGEYCFVGLVGGTWSVSEVEQEGWIATTPKNVDVSISQFEGSINNNFGNFKLANISGFKFNDLDGNGTIDSEEPKISDWKIFIRKFEDVTSASTTTNSLGMYGFDNLGPGRYIVSEATSSEWMAIFPTNGQHDITVSSGGIYENNNFLNQKKEVGGEPALHPITVCKYIDETGDGKTLASTTEDMLYVKEGGWAIMVFDSASEAISQGNTQDGCVTFNLEEGSYKVSETSKTDWMPTDAYVDGEKTQFQRDSFFDVFVHLEITSTTTATSTVDFFNRFTGGSNNGDGDGNPNPQPSPSPSPSGGSGGGGGGGGGIFGLIIHTENATDTSSGGTYSARVTWFTNHGATSRVVYDTVSHPELGEAPNHGYAFSTPLYDQNPKVTFHSIVIDGLVANTIYYFRPFSASSPERWGKELAVSVGVLSGGDGGGSNPSGEAGGGGQLGNGSETSAGALPGQGSGEPFGIGGENPNAGKILGTEFGEDANANTNTQAGQDENANTNANTNIENSETKTAGEAQNQSYKFFFWILMLIILAWLFFLWYNKKDDDDSKGEGGDKSGADTDPRNLLDKIE